jgi:peptide/nickel transport system ATP-binding protein
MESIMKASQPLIRTDALTKKFNAGQSLRDRLFGTGEDPLIAVDNVSLSLEPREIKGVIGESGCGKTTLLKTIAGLHDPTSGEISYRGTPVDELSKEKRAEFRRKTSLIFQEPFNSLNPKFSVKKIVREPLVIHDMDDRDRRIREALERAHLTPPERFLGKRPQQLSGGERQRVAIARAIVSEPDVILADEPVSMLDVSIQASILKLLKELAVDYDISILYISHDLSTVSYLCHEVNVMYLGRIVETALTQELIDNPKHPYTQELLKAIPVPNPTVDRERTQIEAVPNPDVDVTTGCRFRDRCPERMDICEEVPPLLNVGENHRAACHLWDENVKEGGD